MKKLCLLLALLLVLTGCGKEGGKPEQTTAPAYPNDSGHVDKNDDGLCDDCKEAMLVTFDVYAINDLHGRLADTPYQPGADELTTYLKQVKDNAIILSTGDMWQGTSEANLTKGQIVTEWMNEAGFDAMTLGGHEFDFGEEQIRQNRELAHFPFLSINIYNRQTNQQADYCQSSLVVELEGVQIGIIGAIGNCYSSIASENTKDVYFINGDALTALVKEEAAKLRSQGVDFIIYAIHDGSDKTTSETTPMAVNSQDLAGYYDTALSDGSVDLVFEADSHYWYLLTDPQGVYHLQAGGNNKGLSHARVLINKANGNAEVVCAELLPTGTYLHEKPDPAMAQLLEKYAQLIAPATEVLGINGQYRSGNGVCQLVAELYCRKGMEKWGDRYDIVLGGGYISCRNPGYMDAGEVDYSLLQSLLPYDNPINLCSIQGRDLIDKFLETDHHAYFIKTTPYGESIRNSIDPDATYYVVTDSYSSGYANNNMTVIDTYAENIYARDLMAEFISQGGLN